MHEERDINSSTKGGKEEGLHPPGWILLVLAAGSVKLLWPDSKHLCGVLLSLFTNVLVFVGALLLFFNCTPWAHTSFHFTAVIWFRKWKARNLYGIYRYIFICNYYIYIFIHIVFGLEWGYFRVWHFASMNGQHNPVDVLTHCFCLGIFPILLNPNERDTLFIPFLLSSVAAN